MKIIIAGAGEVGSHLARMLGSEEHSITVIDSDPKLLDDIKGLADIVTIEGDCTTFAALKRASVRKADLFIAVNHEENINIISAMLAKQLGARKSIARIDNNEYLEPNNKEMFMNMGIDYLFYPEKVAAREVINLLGHTSTTEYVDFSGGRLTLVVFPIGQSSEFTGKTVEEVHAMGGGVFRPVAISRDNKTIIPHSHDMFYDGDTVYIITDSKAAKTVMNYSGNTSVPIKNLMILGGSRIGVRIAMELQDEINVKLIEYDADKAYRLAEMLDNYFEVYEDMYDDLEDRFEDLYDQLEDEYEEKIIAVYDSALALRYRLAKQLEQALDALEDRIEAAGERELSQEDLDRVLTLLGLSDTSAFGTDVRMIPSVIEDYMEKNGVPDRIEDQVEDILDRYESDIDEDDYILSAEDALAFIALGQDVVGWSLDRLDDAVDDLEDGIEQQLRNAALTDEQRQQIAALRDEMAQKWSDLRQGCAEEIQQFKQELLQIKEQLLANKG